ncbi:UTP:RNA uridylyltransferase 1 [Senna tora]|uniref:RNA uridylyltransferase n=1 Tax=Senna tora TaxID=362788 RepID=A0A834TSA0_9FABA|nr:UTP:RNA uridylyltransferase 1 [Senna tora]
MTGGGGDAPLPPADNGGEFLLSLLQRPPNHHPQPQLQPPLTPAPPPQSLQQQQSPAIDPAVAAIGPTIPIMSPWQGNGLDPQHHLAPWPHTLSPHYPPNIFGLPQTPFHPHPHPRVPANHFPGNPIPVGNIGVALGDDLRRLGFPADLTGGNRIEALVQQQKLQEQKLKFGSLPADIYSHEVSSEGDSLLNLMFNVAKGREAGANKSYNGFDRNLQLDPKATSNSNSSVNVVGHPIVEERRGSGRGNSYHSGNYRHETRQAPPGFSNKPKGRGHWGSGTRRRGSEFHEDREAVNSSELSGRNENAMERVGKPSSERSNSRGNKSNEVSLTEQLDRPGPPTGSYLHSVSGSDMEELRSNFQSKVVLDGIGDKYQGVVRSKKEYVTDSGSGGEQVVESPLLEDESEDKNNSKQHRSSRDKDVRSDSRGQRLLTQRARLYKRQMMCRSDINSLNVPFLALYGSLIPPEEEKAKQKQLLTLLENLVNKEWPNAKLYLYGSCANSFGVSKSDIDVCLAIDETDMDKSEILLKLADILKSDNLQNVQALTRARVPIVKLMDPVTGISCDICINNLLAVVNTKLLRDYAQIDARLRQLAFIIKHWAKSRGVNETYQGTLSSYAYVLMCIHFLQQRRPAILPCLQEMESTYSVAVDDIECAFFDQVEKLHDFGHQNKETIAQLVWGFFYYWAYCHDYTSSVISVRTGTIISKREKDWTRRIGNDRHLICIEDPFEVSHDLGRVVDKFSIKVLREEFERAADVLQFDPNPCVKLFEPYVPS